MGFVENHGLIHLCRLMVQEYAKDTNIEYPHMDIDHKWIEDDFGEEWYEKFFGSCGNTNEQAFQQSFVNYMIGKLTDKHWKKLISWIVDYEWAWLNIFPFPTDNDGNRVCYHTQKCVHFLMFLYPERHHARGI